MLSVYDIANCNFYYIINVSSDVWRHGGLHSYICGHRAHAERRTFLKKPRRVGRGDFFHRPRVLDGGAVGGGTALALGADVRARCAGRFHFYDWRHFTESSGGVRGRPCGGARRGASGSNSWVSVPNVAAGESTARPVKSWLRLFFGAGAARRLNSCQAMLRWVG